MSRDTRRARQRKVRADTTSSGTKTPLTWPVRPSKRDCRLMFPAKERERERERVVLQEERQVKCLNHFVAFVKFPLALKK